MHHAHQLAHHNISASIPAVLLKASSAYGYIAPTLIDITVSHQTSVDYDISSMLQGIVLDNNLTFTAL